MRCWIQYLRCAFGSHFTSGDVSTRKTLPGYGLANAHDTLSGNSREYRNPALETARAGI